MGKVYQALSVCLLSHVAWFLSMCIAKHKKIIMFPS